MQPNPQRTRQGTRSHPANDNSAVRRVVVNLRETAPITITETEVFDMLIGSFAAFAANDNEGHTPKSDAIQAPPLGAKVPLQPDERRQSCLKNDTNSRADRRSSNG
jgi:hypothetical protein